MTLRHIARTTALAAGLAAGLAGLVAACTPATPEPAPWEPGSIVDTEPQDDD